MYAAIGRRIRMMRKERKLTQMQLAEMSGISLSFLGYIERGTRVLSVDTLCKIAKALQCSTDALLGLDIADTSSLITSELSGVISQLQDIKNRFK